VYEALRGNLVENDGYLFSVSPNEEWIAVMQDMSARDLRVRVLHRRSGKTWDAPLSDWVLEGFPDCFSKDSRQIVIAGKVADLSASMRALELAAIPPGATPLCTLLGFPTGIGGGPALESGTVASSREGTKYESVTEGQVETSVLRITPPGRSSQVDFSPLLAADGERLAAAAAKLPPELAEILKDHAKTPAVVILDKLSVSPDGKSLAAVATIYRGPVGFAGAPYGVLVPLDRGQLCAHPFAQNVYHKMLWTSDSKAVYYYAQPQAGTGNGTVHRQAVAGMRLSREPTAEGPRPGR
jgi:hypothetical protein